MANNVVARLRRLEAKIAPARPPFTIVAYDEDNTDRRSRSSSRQYAGSFRINLARGRPAGSPTARFGSYRVMARLNFLNALT